MENEGMDCQENLAVLQPYIDVAESQRDAQSLDALQKYLSLHVADLLPLTETLSEGVFEKLIHYLGSGDEKLKNVLQKKYQTLWEMLLRENTAGTVGLLLIKEIIVSQMLLEFCTEKFVRLYGYSGSKEGRLMESIQTRYLKSLKMFQKINGKIPSIEINFHQVNIQA